MRYCDTCGGVLGEDAPYAVCPKCLFGTALDAAAPTGEEDGSQDMAGTSRRLAGRAGAGGAEEAAFDSSPLTSGLWPNLARRDFFRKYEILEHVAEGGQGDIWKVWDFELRRCVAMKRLSEETVVSAPAVYRFLAEAQIASQLEHPGILPVFDVGLDPDGRPFYTTQLLPGTSLGDVWEKVRGPQAGGAGRPKAEGRRPKGIQADGNAQNGKTQDEDPPGTLRTTSEKAAQGVDCTLSRALGMLLRVCEVMAHAHSRGVIHRDLKPSNVLVGPFGDVRVIDWGSAHILKEARGKFEEPFVPLNQPAIETDRAEAIWADPDSPLATARAGQPITALFTPPEILRGRTEDYGPETDVYSLGVILYDLLAGRPPYSRPDGSLPKPAELKALILDGPPPPVRSMNRAVSRDLAAVCQKAMAYERGERYRGMPDLAEDIRAVLEVRPVQARKPRLLLKLQKWALRNSGYVMLGGLALLIAAAAFFVVRGVRSERDVARQVTALRSAELAARSGQWREALRHLDEAQAAGYADAVDLGLQRAEAWTVLTEPERSRAELIRLMHRSDLGPHRALVLLRWGEHELFDQATANQGVRDVREALALGLAGADEVFARGLLAETTPEALDLFHRALQINSFHHGAHRHSLGLEFVLGHHAELHDSFRLFQALYPDDPSAGFLEAAELAAQGRLEQAEKRLAALSATVDNDTSRRLKDGLPRIAATAKHYALDVVLSSNRSRMPVLEPLQAAGRAICAPPTSSAGARAPARMAQLPSIQNGLLEGRAALGALMLPFVGDIESSVNRIKASWRRHPEALVPALAAIYLETRQPTNGHKSIRLLALQAELFQLAADSSSVLPSIGRTSRYLAAKCEFELFQTGATNAVPARLACLANIRQAAASPEVSGAELSAYFELALGLGEYDLARELLARWGRLLPGDPLLLRARIQLEVAAGNLDAALKLIEKALAEHPQDDWLQAQRESALRGLHIFLDAYRENTHSSR